jgi:hypothetical protein
MKNLAQETLTSSTSLGLFDGIWTRRGGIARQGDVDGGDAVPVMMCQGVEMVLVLVTCIDIGGIRVKNE